MGQFKQVWQFGPGLHVRQKVPEESTGVRPEIAVKADAGKPQAQRIRLAQRQDMMLDKRPAHTAAFTTAAIEKSAKLEIRGTKSEILNHPESNLVNLTRLNTVTIRDS